MASYLLAGFAGTRAIMLPDGHMNPRADLNARVDAVSRLLQAADESTFVAQLARTPADDLLHTPADTSQYRLLSQRHAHWTVTDSIPLVVREFLLYRIRPAVARTPPTPSRP